MEKHNGYSLTVAQQRGELRSIYSKAAGVSEGQLCSWGTSECASHPAGSNVLSSHSLPTLAMQEPLGCFAIFSQGLVLSCPGEWEVLKPKWGRKWGVWERGGASWSWETLGRGGSASCKPRGGSGRQGGDAKKKAASACVEVECGVCFGWEAWAVWMKMQGKGGTERGGLEETVNMLQLRFVSWQSTRWDQLHTGRVGMM